MHSISIVLVFALVAIASAAPAEDKPHYDLGKAPEYFEKFIKDYNKVYKDDADREVHYQAFVKTLAKINQLNGDNDTDTFGINHFSDFTEEEWKKLLPVYTDRPGR
ncbi:senescence-specific cysteine protease SAG39-like [Helicoverpa zea]|uniref:senescence-specific cysteine protease SAG39-like n=1 Tax=Helicoverpa zea TaxID=7113 RepID=UPI001F58CC34|nr:senescence-specific cysteine protease SAG39-like [Helicoverpa zea]